MLNTSLILIKHLLWDALALVKPQFMKHTVFVDSRDASNAISNAIISAFLPFMFSSLSFVMSLMAMLKLSIKHP